MSEFMKEIILILLGEVIVCNGIWVFIQFLITRKDKRKDDLADIKKALDEIKSNQTKNEKDVLRTQLLIMITQFPTEKHKILELAKHYFVDLKGNWFATDIFNTWLEEYKVGKPEWFHPKD